MSGHVVVFPTDREGSRQHGKPRGLLTGQEKRISFCDPAHENEIRSRHGFEESARLGKVLPRIRVLSLLDQHLRQNDSAKGDVERGSGGFDTLEGLHRIVPRFAELAPKQRQDRFEVIDEREVVSPRGDHRGFHLGKGVFGLIEVAGAGRRVRGISVSYRIQHVNAAFACDAQRLLGRPVRGVVLGEAEVQDRLPGFQRHEHERRVFAGLRHDPDFSQQGHAAAVIPVPNAQVQQESGERDLLLRDGTRAQQLQTALLPRGKQGMLRLSVQNGDDAGYHLHLDLGRDQIRAANDQHLQLAHPAIGRSELVPLDPVAAQDAGAGEKLPGEVVVKLESRVRPFEKAAPLRRIDRREACYAAPIEQPRGSFGLHRRNRRDPDLQSGMPALREQTPRVLADEARQTGPIAGVPIELHGFCDLSVGLQKSGRAPGKLGQLRLGKRRSRTRKQELAQQRMELKGDLAAIDEKTSPMERIEKLARAFISAQRRRGGDPTAIALPSIRPHTRVMDAAAAGDTAGRAVDGRAGPRAG